LKVGCGIHLYQDQDYQKKKEQMVFPR
jgi:hypothetical protein